MAACRVLVLGGSSGIGLAFARRVRSEPAIDLQVTAPSPAAAEAVRATLGDTSGTHVVDLLDVSDEALQRVTVGTDVLVLSAGLEYVGPIGAEPPGTFEQLVAVNTLGPARAIRSCLPGMVERGSGLIIGLGSIVTDGPRPFLAGYTASKSAFESYLNGLAGEVQGTGVSVELLRLGPVATDLGSHGPMNWAPDPTSPYYDGYLAARAGAERERAELMRTPEDVAEEMLGRLRTFRGEKSRGDDDPRARA